MIARAYCNNWHCWVDTVSVQARGNAAPEGVGLPCPGCHHPLDMMRRDSAIEIPPAGDSPPPKTRDEKAKDWLASFLEGGVWYAARHVHDVAESEGISVSRLYRARKALGNIEVRKDGSGWKWRIAPASPPTPAGVLPTPTEFLMNRIRPGESVSRDVIRTEAEALGFDWADVLSTYDNDFELYYFPLNGEIHWERAEN